MKIILGLLTLILMASKSTQNQIAKFSCEIIPKNYIYVQNVNTCQVKEELYLYQDNINLEIANHQIYVHLLAFSIIKKSIFYLPKRIEIFFPSLEILEVIQSGLKYIRSEDLKPFQSLRELNLARNNIEVLEANLFQYNSKLEGVILSDNQISTVHQMAFHDLNNLKLLGFMRNSCFSNMTRSPDKVPSMINAIKCSCNELNNHHLRNLENIRNKIAKSNVDIINIKDYLHDVNKNMSIAFEAHEKGMEGLRKQLIEKQKNLEELINQQSASVKQGMHANLTVFQTKLTDIGNSVSSCSQNIHKIEKDLSSMNSQVQKLSNDLDSSIVQLFDESLMTWRLNTSNATTKSMTIKNASHSSSFRSKISDKLVELFISTGIFKSILEFNRWINTTVDLVKVVEKIKKDIKDLQTHQLNITNEISDILNYTQSLVQNSSNTNQSSSILANLFNNNPADFMTYILITNIILIILVLANIIYSCCTRNQQITPKTTRPLRIEPPTYRQLVESPNQTPLQTPSNLYRDSIYGQYEYIEENNGRVPMTPAFEDFYSDAISSVRDNVGNSGSDIYTAVYRPERF